MAEPKAAPSERRFQHRNDIAPGVRVLIDCARKYPTTSHPREGHTAEVLERHGIDDDLARLRFDDGTVEPWHVMNLKVADA